MAGPVLTVIAVPVYPYERRRAVAPAVTYSDPYHSRFDVDEASLAIGVDVLSGAVLSLSNRE